MTEYTSDHIGVAAAATTNRGQVPRYNLSYDLATGQWVNAAQFRQFVRDTLPATQSVAQQQAQQAHFNSEHFKELQLAQNHDQYGIALNVSPEEAAAYSKAGWLGKKGWEAKKAIGIVKNSFMSLGAAVVGHDNSLGDHPYEDYTKAGGLLSEAEFNGVGDNTKLWLLNRAKATKDIKSFGSLPGIHQLGEGVGLAYRGATAGAEVASGAIGHASPSEFFSPQEWAKGWREAQGESLGNALINIPLDPFYSDETLDRWKRENPFYQMSSMGTELLATWYADPSVIAGKGLGAAARLKRGEMPLNEGGAYGRGLGQKLAREQVTVRNPITKGIVNVQARRMTAGWKDIEQYALATSAPEFARNLPMWASRYRATDGGAGAFALHWAYNNRAAANDLLNSETVRTSMQGVADAHGFTLPPKLDVADLTQQLMLGDPKAYAMVSKLRDVSPDELQRIAPGSGTLLSSLDALTTKANVFQSEVDDLVAAADKVGDPRAATTFPEWSHRWEVHTSLEKRQAQLAETTNALRKYEGYDNWLQLIDGSKGDPRIMRVAKPSKDRWSEVRTRDGAEVEQRALFQDNQYGHAHAYHKIPKGLFLKRANAAELDMAAGVNSGIDSITRTFDQLDAKFGYHVPGAKDSTIESYVRANTAFDRYKIMHDLEETHVIGAIAQRFGLDAEVARGIVHKIYDERNSSMNGILSGEGQVYRTAPTLGQRLKGENSGLELVARDEDTGMLTINVMNGRQKQTYVVPEASLQPRVAPEDLPQTPNYYNPLDHRRLFYKIKHDHRLLEEINAGWAKNTQAATADLGELVGTRFNEFWKPVQLFRLGWPMRVLMDEGARATAIYGPMYWVTGPGAEATYQSGRNTLPIVADWLARKRKGPLGQDMLGPSTTAQGIKREPNQFARDAEVAQAVQLPQSMWDKINPTRLEKTRADAVAFQNWQRENARYDAWRRASQLEKDNALLSHALTGGELSPAQQRLLDFANGKARVTPGNRPEPHIFNIAKQYYDRLKRSADREQSAPLVFDHVSGREHKSGYVVPNPDFAHVLDVSPGAIGGGLGSLQGVELMKWYTDHAEVLSRQGMRVVVDPSGHLTIGRHFRSNEFTKARQYAEFVSEKHSDVKMWNVGDKRSYVVRPADDLSPADEATYRYFATGQELQRGTGAAPIEGQPEVFHGASRPLPEDLLPRDEVPVDNGRMIGSGLYSSLDQRVIENSGYNAEGVYIIKGSKSGATYRVWDMDKEITPAQRADLENWLDDELDTSMDSGYIMRTQFEEALDNANDRYHAPMTAHDGPGASWANVYEYLANEHGWEAEKFHDMLHRYLEERHNAGALTHRGGTTHGNPHQVYVWLHPEDLHVKPLYEPSGKFYTMPEWMHNPQSVENLIPENRILRKGRANPMLRELRQIDRKLMNYTRKTGVSKYKDPEYVALSQREQELMDALGLEYSHGIPELNADTNHMFVPDRYVVADKGHFDRMIAEARLEDEAHSLRAAAGKDLLAQEEAVGGIGGDLTDFDFQINDLNSWLMNKIHERHEMGVKYIKVKSSDGKTDTFEGAFSGHDGELFRGLTRSNGVMDVLSEGHGGGTSLGRRQSEGYRVYQPPEFNERALRAGTRENKKAVLYFQRYADMVNDHLGNSPVIQRIIAGHSDERIIDWLENSTQGQRIANEFKPLDTPTGLWVEDFRSKFDYYVPSRKLQRLLGKGRLKPTDFRKNIADEDLPTIYGPDFEVLDRHRHAGEMLSDTANKLYEALGTLPIDALSRSPFAKAAYDTKVRAITARTNSKYLTPEMRAQIRKDAHKFALGQVRRHLYNLTETTNFNDMLRFVAPFWGAQFEAIQKWLRIISDRPETLARFFGAQRAVYNNFVIQDQDGNPVTSGIRPGGLMGLGLYHPGDRVIMPMPDFMRKRFFNDLPIVGKYMPSLQYVGSTAIPLGSANTVLQGDLPLAPSLGPLVTIPADQFLRKVSDTYAVEHDQDLLYRWLFPIGRPRSKTAFGQLMDQFSPGWINRVRQSSGPEDAQARINMEMTVGREMLTKARAAGKPDPTPGDIKKAADHLWATRVMSSLVLPFQTQYLPDHQYWVDAFHRYQKQYGNDAWDKFVDKYGDEAAIYATSSSNSVGVPPTDQGMSEWSQNKTLIQKYPNWTSAIISPQAYMGDFSSDAYGQQFNINLGPGDTRTLRSGTSLQDRLETDPETRLGWREFRKLDAAIEAELNNRGLTSIQQNGAQDLAEIKRAMVGQIMQKYRPWARAYQQQSQEIYSDVEDLKSFAFNHAFDKRPDMLGVRNYLMIRQQATDMLDQHGQSGGSRSLQAQENGALRDWFYNQVGALVQENPAFAEFYSRYLSNDTLTLGGGGF